MQSVVVVPSSGTGDISGIVAPLQLSSKSLICFAVNDNPDAGNAEGGSHWYA